MAMRDVVLFDLDGTLVDSAPAIASALSEMRVRRGGTRIEANTVRPLISRGADVLVARGLGAFATSTNDDLAAFRAILQALPVDPASIYPGVKNTLASLQASGILLGVLTNKPEGLSRSLLHQLGLMHFFRAIAGGDTTPFAKPHPAPARHVLAALGAGAERAILVGDSAIDARSASALAMPFVLFLGGYGGDEIRDADVSARFAEHASLPGILRNLSP